MATFTLTCATNEETIQPIYKLSRDGRCYYDEFVSEIRGDANLKPELGNLWPILKDVANGKRVPRNKYRKENIGQNLPFTVYAAKSENLRLYTFADTDGMIIIIGGKKTEQDEDLLRAKRIVKEYSEFKNKKV